MNRSTAGRGLIFLLLALFLFALVSSGSPRPLSPDYLVILHTTIIDATGAEAASDQTVVIDAGRISAIGNPATIPIPKNARALDATGKFLIPGLWDMHVHALQSERPTSFFPEFIASGVTGVRDMGILPGELEQAMRLRELIEEGRLLGPHLVVSGPVIDGPHPMFPELSIAVSNESEARQAVRHLRHRGADFIKVYSLLPRDAYFAIADEAKQRGIPFAGHVPESVTASEVSEAGQKSIEHLSGIRLGCSTSEAELKRELVDARATGDAALVYQALRRIYYKSRETYSREKADALFRRLVRNGTWQVPTLVVSRFIAQQDNNPKVTTDLAADFKKQTTNDACINLTSDQFESAGDSTQSALDLVRRMRQAGVRFMVGTDAPHPFVIPGRSLHDELELLVQAGFTPMEAIQAATRNPAEYLGLLETLGTVEQKKIADLVLLDANPLEDISNTRKIWAVIVRGRVAYAGTIEYMAQR